MSGCTCLRGRLAAQMHSGGWEPPRYKRLKPNLLDALEGEVIEIGPGSGVNLKYYRDNVHWPGVEPNTFLHERIRRRAAALGIAPRLLAGSAERLDSPDESVDAVVGTLVLCSVGDQARALAEVLRVLKPGGGYVFVEHVAASLGTRTRRIQETWTPILRRLPGGCSPNRETRGVIERVSAPSQMSASSCQLLSASRYRTSRERQSNGNQMMIYVTGYTRSADYPTTLGAFDTTFNGIDADAFLTKLPTG